MNLTETNKVDNRSSLCISEEEGKRRLLVLNTTSAQISTFDLGSDKYK